MDIVIHVLYDSQTLSHPDNVTLDIVTHGLYDTQILSHPDIVAPRYWDTQIL
jgi:hypothetical protein